jgi:hypothetical protein
LLRTQLTSGCTQFQFELNHPGMFVHPLLRSQFQVFSKQRAIDKLYVMANVFRNVVVRPGIVPQAGVKQEMKGRAFGRGTGQFF